METPGSDLSWIAQGSWFALAGWWLALIMAVGAYFAALTIIRLPLAFSLFNRLAWVAVLRQRSVVSEVFMADDGTEVFHSAPLAQRRLWIRVLWFLVAGLWLGIPWLLIAWLCTFAVVTIPLAVIMFSFTPAVVTLQRN